MGFFNLFKKKEKEEKLLFDFDSLKVDFHSHLLPDLDDGVNYFDESLEIIKKFEDLGYEKLIITPHVMSDFYRNSSEGIAAKFKELQVEIEKSDLKLDLDFAAEYYLDDHFLDLYEKKEILTFGDNYFLFELSYFNEPYGVQEFVFRAKNDGYKPIMAHPERYPYWMDNIDKFKQLQGSGCLFQINMNSFAGHYSLGAKKMAELMVENELVDFICSDCHKIEQFRMMKNTKIKKHLHEMLFQYNRVKNSMLITQ